MYYTSEEQKTEAEQFIKKLMEDGTFTKPITTELKSLDTFYTAEGYHQNYYKNNTDQPYCQAMIDPKIVKLRQKFAHLLKTNE